MITGTELAPGAWALHNSDNERNTGVLFDAEGHAPAMAVDPGYLPTELDALAKFAEDMGRTLGALVFTQEPGDHPGMQRWPAVIVITPASRAEAPLLPLPVSGWETAALSPRMLGLYHKQARLLLCGALLQNGTIPTLDTGADSYLQVLEELEALDAKLVLPQHGTPARGKREVRARIVADRDYTQNLVRHVLTSLAANLPIDRVLSVARAIYEDYPFLEAHLHNIQSVWREFAR